jgi:hypothetical protein
MERGQFLRVADRAATDMVMMVVMVVVIARL